ncbi:DUF7289 family protein [Natronoglomus mannanivorans]|uniref:Ig-like domain-containing protein n=1 Tax=Natronoglomus mannanivorans TaxID=2979990 RepID=A0AAP3E262_9EURY|nr:Ig-like domain-containing protein [Halobacteria archaeon AArc-xg1-1]
MTMTTASSDTDRAVSPVIGAILIFGLVLALLAILQMTAVPALNEQREFQHNDRVQTDIVGVGETIEQVAATGSKRTVSVETGLHYPPRMFFLNPPPVAGTVRTTDSAEIEIANARATGETGDYWDGGTRTFETRSLEYVPKYNEYSTAPVTVAEPWVVFNRFDDATLTVTEQDLVDGRRIDLVALEGERSVSRAGSAPIGVEPTSAPTRTITVRADGDPVTLTIPTRLGEEEWGDLLADELDPTGNPDTDGYVTEFDCRTAPPAPCEELTITLQQGATYELRLGAVAVGSDVAAEEAAYLTDVDGNATAVPEGGRQRLVVEARDRFDNPVSGVRVNGNVGDGTVRAVDPVTDTEGRATFVYEAPDTVDHSRTVEVTTRFGDEPREEVTFDVRVMTLGSGDTSAETSPTVTISDVAANVGGNQDRYTVDVEATDSDGDLERVDYELRDPETNTVIDTATASVSGEEDTASRQLRARGAERADEYRITVTVVDVAGNTGSDETTVSGGGS